MDVHASKLTDEAISQRDIQEWPIWTCEVSEFDWECTENESCLLLEGEVRISAVTQSIVIQAGDFVTFPAGLKCRWKVLKAVRKHYQFHRNEW